MHDKEQLLKLFKQKIHGMFYLQGVRPSKQIADFIKTLMKVNPLGKRRDELQLAPISEPDFIKHFISEHLIGAI